MIVRNLVEIEETSNYVEWGAGTSHRLVTSKDNIGFTICHTVVWPYTESLLEYKNHLEACYCIEGEGEVVDMNGITYAIKPGTVYVLDKNDKHILRNKENKPFILVSVFNPPLLGDETHSLGKKSSHY